MNHHTDVVEILKETIDAAKRPLSSRRLLKLCHAAGWTGELWTQKGIELVMRSSGEFVEPRTGVFLTANQLEFEDAGGHLDGTVISEDKESGDPVFPDSVNAVVMLRERTGARSQLKTLLKKRIEHRVFGMISKPESQSEEAVDERSTEDRPMLKSTTTVRARSLDETYVERRVNAVPVSRERRNRRLNSRELPQLPAQIKEILEASGKALTIDAIQHRLNRTAARVDRTKLRMSVLVENERCRHQGRREEFFVDEENQIGLTSWGLPNRLIELEVHMQQDRLETEEVVKRALLSKLADLDPVGFREAAVLLLERNGITDLKYPDETSTDPVVLIGVSHREHQPQNVIIFLRQSWEEVLGGEVEKFGAIARQFNAKRALLMTIGVYHEEALRMSSEIEGVTFQLIDGVALANSFYQARLGVKTVTWTTHYPDGEFFKNLTVAAETL